MPQMDQHDILQYPGSGAGEQEAFSGISNQVVGPAKLPSVSSSACPLFGAPAP